MVKYIYLFVYVEIIMIEIIEISQNKIHNSKLKKIKKKIFFVMVKMYLTLF